MIWYVERSPIHGAGVFAGRPIFRDDPIGLAHWRDSRSQWHATALGRYHNHSERPTARSILSANGMRQLFANINLAPGDEITVDYRMQPEFEQPQAGWQRG